MTESPLVDSGFAVPVFSLGDDPCLSQQGNGFSNSCSFIKVNAYWLEQFTPANDRECNMYKDKAILAEPRKLKNWDE
ncbi:hypothetical protein Tco_0774751 [Tanacetum coccineum]|uniref:Uncharacterized protein n=1 Tax=Tanacetum coccineum TaxID=301880 RepID=A0ABQ4ZPD1_9ASTR